MSFERFLEARREQARQQGQPQEKPQEKDPREMSDAELAAEQRRLETEVRALREEAVQTGREAVSSKNRGIISRLNAESNKRRFR